MNDPKECTFAIILPEEFEFVNVTQVDKRVVFVTINPDMSLERWRQLFLEVVEGLGNPTHVTN